MSATDGLRVLVSRRANAKFWRYLAFIALSVALVAYWGLNKQHQGEYVQNLYRLLVIFTIDIQYANDAKFVTNWQLYITRFLAPFTTLAALLWVLVESFSRWWVMLRLSISAPDIVVLGGGDVSRALISTLLDRGHKEIVLLVGEADEATVSFCELNRVLLLQGDVASRDNLIKLGANKSEACYALTGDDKLNIRVAEQLRGLEPGTSKDDESNCLVAVRIGSCELYRGLYRYQRFTDNAIPFSLETLIARDAVLRYPGYEYAWLRGSRRVHAVIIGFGALGQALAQELALHYHYRDLDLTMVTAISLGDEREFADFEADFPKFHKACVFNKLQAASDNWIEVLPALKELEADDTISAIYVATPLDRRNLRIALSIREEIEQHRCLMAPVFVYSNDGSDFSELFDTASRAKEFHKVIQPFGVLSDVIGDSWLADSAAEDLAMYFHRLYLKAGEKGDSWASLSETMRESNRRAAVHARIKLASVGYRVEAGLSQPISLSPDAKIVTSDMYLSALGELEHRRWMADRYLDGWDYAETRSNTKRLHNMLVPFNHLPENEVAKDHSQVRGLIDRLAMSPASVPVNVSRVFSIAVTGAAAAEEEKIDSLLTKVQDELSQRLNEETEPLLIEIYATLQSGVVGRVTQKLLQLAKQNEIDYRLFTVLNSSGEIEKTAANGETASIIGELIKESEWVFSNEMMRVFGTPPDEDSGGDTESSKNLFPGRLNYRVVVEEDGGVTISKTCSQ